uniref:Uncharacterized protein n=1 Tax=Romanomermis culicivorax TaxID=13658 RepID=A0A915HJM1_ROMCU
MDLFECIDLLDEVVDEDREEEDQDDRPSTRKHPFQISKMVWLHINPVKQDKDFHTYNAAIKAPFNVEKS